MTGDQDTCLIWSNEHGAWWGPNRRGYVRVIEHAGRYTRAEADAIADQASVGGQIHINMPRPDLFGDITGPMQVPPEIVVPVPESGDVTLQIELVTDDDVQAARAAADAYARDGFRGGSNAMREALTAYGRRLLARIEKTP